MWLFSKRIDLFCIYLPIALSWLCLGWLPAQWIDYEIPLPVWVLSVLLVDVGHVWSTIFRTYLAKDERIQHGKLLIWAPLLSLFSVVAVCLFSIDWFWRLLAYFALFHFMKQQYGFMALYVFKSGKAKVKRFLSDKFVLYLSMLYPVIFWHFSGDRVFNWFVPNDFIRFPFLAETINIKALLAGFEIVYWALIGLWWLEELKKFGWAHLGKQLWMLTSILTWYGGIVYYNSDLVFTISNVIAHGIPYVTLIIYYCYEKSKLQAVSPRYSAGFILLAIIFLAWIEEYCWDMLIYMDRPDFFGAVLHYPFEAIQAPIGQAFAIGFLALPQVTHYFLDGFIWKFNASNPFLRPIFSKQ